MEGGFAFYDSKMLKHIPVIPVNQQRGWCKRIQNSSVVYITRPWLVGWLFVLFCFVSEISSGSDLKRD